MCKFSYILVLLFHVKQTVCTVDVSELEYGYLANHLTPEECVRLYAALNFASYDLPDAFSEASLKVPTNFSCIQLLLKWDGGTDKWEGHGKSHGDIVRRLHQIGRKDLAEWLSQSVFFRLANEVNEALDTTFSKKNITMKKFKEFKDYSKPVGSKLMHYDVMLSITSLGLLLVTSIVILKILVIFISRRMTRKVAKQDEIMELLSYGSLDSDQETVYEYIGNKKGGKKVKK